MLENTRFKKEFNNIVISLGHDGRLVSADDEDTYLYFDCAELVKTIGAEPAWETASQAAEAMCGFLRNKEYIIPSVNEGEKSFLQDNTLAVAINWGGRL